MYDYGTGWGESLAFKAFSYIEKQKPLKLAGSETRVSVVALLCAAHLIG